MKIDELANELGKAIEIIAEKMGVAVEKVYPLLAGQVQVEVITNIIIILLLITATITLLMLIIKGFKKDWDEELIYLGLVLPCVIIGIITILATLTSIREILTGLYNPDWYIIKYMLMPLIKQ